MDRKVDESVSWEEEAQGGFRDVERCAGLEPRREGGPARVASSHLDQSTRGLFCALCYGPARFRSYVII